MPPRSEGRTIGFLSSLSPRTIPDRRDLEEERASPMRIAILTNEYPPHVYGGAGVHVEYLTRELAAHGQEVKVLSFGGQREASVTGIDAPVKIPVQDPRHEKLMDTLARNLVMAGTLK